MEKKLISKYNGKDVAVGIRHHSRNAPFFFYGKLLEINENYVLIELENNRGFKSINLAEVVDLHLDPRYLKEADKK